MSKRADAKSSRQAIAELAAQEGYTPAQFTLRRLAEDAERLARWAADHDRGLVPEDLAHMSEPDAFREIRRELRDFIRTEREWAEFFYPKQRAQEHSADPQGPPIIQVLQFGQTDDPGSA